MTGARRRLRTLAGTWSTPPALPPPALFMADVSALIAASAADGVPGTDGAAAALVVGVIGSLRFLRPPVATPPRPLRLRPPREMVLVGSVVDDAVPIGPGIGRPLTPGPTPTVPPWGPGAAAPPLGPPPRSTRAPLAAPPPRLPGVLKAKSGPLTPKPLPPGDGICAADCCIARLEAASVPLRDWPRLVKPAACCRSNICCCCADSTFNGVDGWEPCPSCCGGTGGVCACAAPPPPAAATAAAFCCCACACA